jgi:hypothetical protein
MRILTSILSVLGALAAAYLGLYAGMIVGENVMVAPGDTLLLAAPLLALAGAIAVWLRPALARLALWSALAAWLAFGAAITLFGADGIEGRDLLGAGVLMILPAALIAGAANAAGRLCRQLHAPPR